MADIDKQKEIVTKWRSLYLVLIGAMFGLVGYVFDKYEKLSNEKLIILAIGGIVLLVIVAMVNKKLDEEIDKLKDL